MKLLKLVVIIFCALQINARGQSPLLKTYGDVNGNFMVNFVTDADGNSYAMGSFYTAAFQFGDVELINDHANSIYLVKIDPDGNAVWGITAYSDASLYAGDIGLDHDGNILICGTYYGDSPIFSGVALPEGISNAFIAKYKNDGTLIWAKAQPAETMSVNKIAISDNNEILIGGNITGTELFNGEEVEAYGDYDGFIARFDENGNGIWMKSFGGESIDNVYSLAFDHEGNILLGGSFASDFSYGDLSFDNMGLSDGFVMKLTPDGESIWAITNQSEQDEYGPDAIVVDASNDVYGAIEIYDGAMLSETVVSSYGSSDACLFKLHGDDGSLSWNKHGGSITNDLVQGLEISTGGLFMTGTFYGAAEFDGLQLYADITNGFIAAYDLNGNAQSVYGIIGADFITPAGLHVDAHGNTYTMGVFYDDIHVEGLDGLFTAGGQDIFLYKFSSELVSVNEQSISNIEINIFPNPATDFIQLEIPAANEIKNLSILNSTGQAIYVQSCASNLMQIEVDKFPAGTYFISAENKSGICTKTQTFIKN